MRQTPFDGFFAAKINILTPRWLPTAWVSRFLTDVREKVTVASFVFVAIDKNGRPRPIPFAPRLNSLATLDLKTVNRRGDITFGRVSEGAAEDRFGQDSASPAAHPLSA